MPDTSGTFYVKNRLGKTVPAKFATYNGQYIADPNTANAENGGNGFPKNPGIFDVNGNPIPDANPNGYLIVPENFNVTEIMQAASVLGPLYAANQSSSSVLAATSGVNGILIDGMSNSDDCQPP